MADEVNFHLWSDCSVSLFFYEYMIINGEVNVNVYKVVNQKLN